MATKLSTTTRWERVRQDFSAALEVVGGVLGLALVLAVGWVWLVLMWACLG